MIIRVQRAKNRFLAALAVTACLVAFGIACNGSPTEPAFPTPDPHALVPPPGPSIGAPDLSVWIPDGWRAPINFDEDSLEIMVAWANRGTAMAEDYSILLTSDGRLVHRWQKPFLAPGSERVEVLSLNDVPELYMLVQGLHELELVLDPDEVVPELDRRNNTFSLTRDFHFQLPDLKPSPPANAGWDGPVVVGGYDLVYGEVVGAAERGHFLAFGVSYEGAERAQAWPQQHSIEMNGYQIDQWEFFYDLDDVSWPEDVKVPIWEVAVGAGLYCWETSDSR